MRGEMRAAEGGIGSLRRRNWRDWWRAFGEKQEELEAAIARNAKARRGVGGV